jgi:hypothetical protein
MKFVLIKTNSDTYKDEKSFHEMTISEAKKFFTKMKRKYKNTNILLTMGKMKEDGKYYGFLRS